jgi:hypothetical protein
MPRPGKLSADLFLAFSIAGIMTTPSNLIFQPFVWKQLYLFNGIWCYEYMIWSCSHHQPWHSTRQSPQNLNACLEGIDRINIFYSTQKVKGRLSSTKDIPTPFLSAHLTVNYTQPPVQQSEGLEFQHGVSTLQWHHDYVFLNSPLSIRAGPTYVNNLRMTEPTPTHSTTRYGLLPTISQTTRDNFFLASGIQDQHQPMYPLGQRLRDHFLCNLV